MDMQSPGMSDGPSPVNSFPPSSQHSQQQSQHGMPQPQVHQQQPPIQQQPQQQQQRDVVLLFNERLRIILEPNGDLQRKIKTFEVRLVTSKCVKSLSVEI